MLLSFTVCNYHTWLSRGRWMGETCSKPRFNENFGQSVSHLFCRQVVSLWA
jgi:hypothetical protein